MAKSEVMADVKEPEVQPVDVKAQEVQSNEDVKEETPTGAENIPYHRFKEVVDKLNTAEEKLTERETKEKQRQEKELEEKGEFKQLLDEARKELDREKKKSSKWEAFEKVRREKITEDWPDEEVAIYSNLSLEDLEAHNELRSQSRTPAGVESGKSGVSHGKPIALDDFDAMTSEEKKTAWPVFLKQRQR
jgi:vacuolar-type H+-ATPase subunit I/STV1